jgi:hypothetical protein
MRTYIASGVAVLLCSSAAFVGGVLAAPSLRAVAQADCVPPATDAELAAEGEPESVVVSGEEEAAAAPKEKVLTDEDVWPFRNWVVEKETKDDRLYSKVRFLWIRPEARETTTFLGYLSLGDSVRLKGGSKESAFAAKSNSVYCHTWYEVEPRGYVCINDDNASFDPDDQVIAMLRAEKADRLSPWPYDYGESVSGTPIYSIIPPKHSQRRNESALEKHLSHVRQARMVKTDEEKVAIAPNLAGVDVQLTKREPPTLLPLGPRGRTNKSQVVRGSTLGFVDTFDADGRSWLLSWDRGIVPRDRVKLYEKSKFHGVSLDDKVKLPIAFFREEQPRYQRNADGKIVPVEGKIWKRQSWVMVTEEQLEQDGKRYIVTKEDGLLASVNDVSLARRSHYIPPRIEAQQEGRRTWIDVSILGGWLVAYELNKPVYVTMISPGRGGVPKHGVDPLETASTPVGRFRITGKFVTATMVSNASKDIIHDEVMYTQNFSGPYALHGAYWHDQWGKPKSGGCVNLAPTDARRLFAWTDPQLPPSWHAVQLVTGYEGALVESENATLVYLHK